MRISAPLPGRVVSMTETELSVVWDELPSYGATPYQILSRFLISNRHTLVCQFAKHAISYFCVCAHTGGYS